MRVTKSGRRAAQAGMTLIEILVVILILGMVLTAVGTNVFGIFGQAKEKQARNEIMIMKENIELYISMNSKIPQSLEEFTEKGLLDNVKEGEVPLDPWDREYMYEPDPSHPDRFRLWSRGANPDDDGDDISSDNIGRSSKDN